MVYYTSHLWSVVGFFCRGGDGKKGKERDRAGRERNEISQSDISELNVSRSWIVPTAHELKTSFSWIDSSAVVVVNSSNNFACLNEEGGLRSKTEE